MSRELSKEGLIIRGIIVIVLKICNYSLIVTYILDLCYGTMKMKIEVIYKTLKRSQ